MKAFIQRPRGAGFFVFPGGSIIGLWVGRETEFVYAPNIEKLAHTIDADGDGVMFN